MADFGFEIVDTFAAEAAPAEAAPAEDEVKDESHTYYDIVRSPELSGAEVFNEDGVCFMLCWPKYNETVVSLIAHSHADCNECTRRAKLYVRLQGPKGRVFFSQVGKTPCKQINQLMDNAALTCNKGTPELFLVKADTFPKAQVGKSAGGQLFYHWNIQPKEVTSPETAARFELLQQNLAQMDSRLSKLTEPEAVNSVVIMAEERSKLTRPNHWTSVIEWVTGIQKKAVGKSFAMMTDVEKFHLRVYALMTGRVDKHVHLDFQQAANIVDFLTAGSREELRGLMDSRSDPATYMRQQLIQKLDAKGISSQWTIGLVWDGKYTDDMDIHMWTPNKTHIYYGNKRGDGCVLDFDANASKAEANPAENISVSGPGTYMIEVDDFAPHTKQSVPFEIVCRQVGKQDMVYHGVWPADRKKQTPMFVCKHVFTPVVIEAPVMSEAEARRAKAQAAHWDQHIGDPVATVATIESLVEQKDAEVYQVPKPVYGAGAKPDGAGVNAAFMQLAARPAGKKSYLSENCNNKPETILELAKLVTGDQPHRLQVDFRDYSPGYYVNIKTKEQVRKTTMPSPCYYQKKFELPVKPGEIGTLPSGDGRFQALLSAATARLDESWVPGAGRSVDVEAIVFIEGKWFIVLHGAQLSDSQDFPLGSGFYPTDLGAEFHQHRTRWTFCHSQLKPVVSEEGTSLIGAFLVASKARFCLDGQEVIVAV